MTRYEEASTVPLRSLHMGRAQTPAESKAVQLMQERLQFVAKWWHRLPSRLMARRGPNSPPSAYGPFFFGHEEKFFENLARFGRLTDLAVKQFQEQAGLEVDGKAGINTLGKLNECYV